MRLLLSNPHCIELGLTFIRVAVGVVFMIHGWGKLSGGITTWQWMGSQMGHLGITFLPVMWGFFGMLAEFAGGLCLVLGLGTRLVSVSLICVMVVAIAYHVNKGDTFNNTWSHAFTLLLVFIGFVIAGSGKYSLDHYFFANQNKIEINK